MTMTKTMRRLFSRTALVLLVVMLTTATAWADEREGDWYYTYDSGTNVLTITRYNGTDASVTTPTMLGGHAVTAIGTGCFSNLLGSHGNLTSVTISEGVTTIGQNAFYQCSNLASVSLPNSLTYIGISAFSDCSSLTTITIPSSVTEIGYVAFVNGGLTDLYYAGTKAQWNNVTLGSSIFQNISPAPTVHWRCTATFDMQGHGTAPAAQTVYSGVANALTVPTAPTVQGYDFGGWYRNAACTQAFDFTAALDDNVTVYAKWTALENTIQFDLGGRGSAISNQTVYSGNTVTEPAVQFDGADGIEGWYTDAGRTQKYDFTTEVDHSMTLYAKWAAAGSATITANAGGTATLTNVNGQVFNDGKVMPGNYTLTVTPASGYSFSGTYTLTNRSNSMSDMPYNFVGSATKTYALDLTEKDADINVTFSSNPILTVTTRADDESVLNEVTWSVVNNQTPSTTYDNGSTIPYDTSGMVATDFGIRLSVDLGTLSGYAFTATVTDRGNGSTTKYNSLQGTSFLIQPYGSIDIDLYVYEMPSIMLLDDANNSTTLTKNEGIAAGSITLQGRTLYKDGDWNTLCLPFAVSSFAGTPLEGATVMSLKTSKSGGSGFDAETGTLTLNFTAATSITAGKAYIVKWTKPADYEGNESTYDISDPTFNDVTISSTAPTASTSNDGTVSFTGNYSPIDIAGENRSLLFLGADNKLYYPNAAMTIGACRAYFQLKNGLIAGEPKSVGAKGVSQFVLDFGDENSEATGIRPTPNPSLNGGEWYDLSGRRLSGKPAQEGIYIHNGNKIVIK